MAISQKDREILRSIAARQAGYATSAENDAILKKWDFLAQGKRESPTVRLLFSNFEDEVLDPRMQCEGEEARALERHMLNTLVGRDLFDDDTPIAPTFDVTLKVEVNPFGANAQTTRATARGGKGFHIDPIITDLGDDVEQLRHGFFKVDKQGTDAFAALADSVFGDILPSRIVMNNFCGAITNPLVHLMGMEQYYISMYDYPDELHEIMDLACKTYENCYDYMEQNGLLLPTCGISPISQESFAFNHELPTDKAVKTTDCWGFLESQETTAVSPETFGEFVFPYQDRLVQKFGLLSYGCCERVDAIFEDYLSKWKNLRKLSVSPFNNEMQIGEYLRGSNIVYYSKPRAEFVTFQGPLDEQALEAYFKTVCEASSGCLLEVAQREVGTIFGDYERGKQYVKIAKQCIEKYWKP